MTSGEEILNEKILRVPSFVRKVMRVISDLLLDQCAERLESDARLSGARFAQTGAEKIAPIFATGEKSE